MYVFWVVITRDEILRERLWGGRFVELPCPLWGAIYWHRDVFANLEFLSYRNCMEVLLCRYH